MLADERGVWGRRGWAALLRFTGVVRRLVVALRKEMDFLQGLLDSGSNRALCGFRGGRGGGHNNIFVLYLLKSLTRHQLRPDGS